MTEAFSLPPMPEFKPSDAVDVAVLQLFAKGFLHNERRLLEGTVMLSRRRNPRLQLLDEADANDADVFMVDSADREAMSWARQRPWLEDRTVIWVEQPTHNVALGHIVVNRPVQWPILPMILARAMDQDVRRIRKRQKIDGKGFSHSTFSRSRFEHSRFEHSRIGLPANPSASPSEPRKPKVLVVDDSLAVRSHLCSILGKVGVTVVQADSGEAGLNATQQADFACVLMDVMMPGMDGYETCRRIKAAAKGKRGPSIVMLTSKSSPFDHIRGKMAGCNAYLTKPVDVKKLFETLSLFIPLKP